MKHYKLPFILLILASLIDLYSCSQKKEQKKEEVNYTQYVDPFIGTGGHGHTFPGATLPFGMVQVSPDNGRSGWDWCSGYNYSSDSIYGFSQTHLSGTGIGDMLDISVLPTTRKIPIHYNDSLDFDIHPYFETFNHRDEKASPGYYSVILRGSGIKAEFTATLRAAFHRYTFPKTDTGSLIVNLGFHENWDKPVDTHIKIISDTLLTGFRYSQGWARDQKVFFAMRLSQPLVGFYGSGKDTLYIHDNNSIQAPSSLAILKFNLASNPVLMVKIALSSVSEMNALLNLNQELPDWDFDNVAEDAQDTWNDQLKKVAVTGASPRQMKIFYTALYHSMISPNTLSDDNGDFRGPDDEIHNDTTFTDYHTFSLWDTYRAEHPLFTLLNPDKDKDFVYSLLTFYKESGLLPVWTLWSSETNTMIGYHSVPVIADAFLKGLLPDSTGELIFNAMVASANQTGRDVPSYIKYGYVPADTTLESVSKTLEYAYDDWCIAQVAKKLKKTDAYNEYMKRSESYRNLFDRDDNFMRPKLANGKWKKPFDPFYAGGNNDYVEGNAWQYTWYVPQNIPDLINMMGGKQAFAAKLDSLFIVKSKDTTKSVSDVSGLIGEYAQGNEPSHHIPYLFNYCGQAWKTQKTVRQIINTFYTDQPDGLCGNEDCGQMSAWYVFSCLGFYPVNPVSGNYDLGVPLFPKTELHLENNETFTITANHLNDTNVYVKSVKLNGHPYNRLIVPHDSIMAGGSLEFEMAAQPASR